MLKKSAGFQLKYLCPCLSLLLLWVSAHSCCVSTPQGSQWWWKNLQCPWFLRSQNIVLVDTISNSEMEREQNLSRACCIPCHCWFYIMEWFWVCIMDTTDSPQSHKCSQKGFIQQLHPWLHNFHTFTLNSQFTIPHKTLCISPCCYTSSLSSHHTNVSLLAQL